MNRLSFLKYRAGILFLVISLISIVAQAKTVNFKAHTFDKVVLSGTIKDDNGNAVENAKVIFDTTVVAVTDKTGSFSFELATITPASHNIYFSCDGFSSVVRTYYPVMGSTNYTILLRKLFDKPTTPAKEVVNPGKKDTVALINKPIEKKVSTAPIKKTEPVRNVQMLRTVNTPPIRAIKKDSVATVITEEKAYPAATIVLDFPSILFKPNETALNNMNRAFLDIIAGKLKSNPSVKIDIRSYIPTNNSYTVVAQARLTTIVKYMVEKKGIASGRLNKLIIPGGGDVDIIDVETAKQE